MLESGQARSWFTLSRTRLGWTGMQRARDRIIQGLAVSAYPIHSVLMRGCGTRLILGRLGVHRPVLGAAALTTLIAAAVAAALATFGGQVLAQAARHQLTAASGTTVALNGTVTAGQAGPATAAVRNAIRAGLGAIPFTLRSATWSDQLPWPALPSPIAAGGGGAGSAAGNGAQAGGPAPGSARGSPRDTGRGHARGRGSRGAAGRPLAGLCAAAGRARFPRRCPRRSRPSATCRWGLFSRSATCTPANLSGYRSPVFSGRVSRLAVLETEPHRPGRHVLGGPVHHLWPAHRQSGSFPARADRECRVLGGPPGPGARHGSGPQPRGREVVRPVAGAGRSHAPRSVACRWLRACPAYSAASPATWWWPGRCWPSVRCRFCCWLPPHSPPRRGC